MPNDANPLSPSEESRRIESEAATEILRMLTSDCPETSGDRSDGCQTTQRSLRQETTMWF